MEITKRIEEILAKKNLKASVLCAKTGIAHATYSTWKSKKRNPSADLIVPIAKFLDTCPYFLLTGENYDLSLNLNLSSDEKNLLELYRLLNEQDRSRIILTAEIMSLSTYHITTQKNKTNIS